MKHSNPEIERIVTKANQALQHLDHRIHTLERTIVRLTAKPEPPPTRLAQFRAWMKRRRG